MTLFCCLLAKGRSLFTPGLALFPLVLPPIPLFLLFFSSWTSICYFFLRWGNSLPHVLVFRSVGISSACVFLLFLPRSASRIFFVVLRLNLLDLVVGVLVLS